MRISIKQQHWITWLWTRFGYEYVLSGHERAGNKKDVNEKIGETCEISKRVAITGGKKVNKGGKKERWMTKQTTLKCDKRTEKQIKERRECPVSKYLLWFKLYAWKKDASVSWLPLSFYICTFTPQNLSLSMFASNVSKAADVDSIHTFLLLFLCSFHSIKERVQFVSLLLCTEMI